MRRRRCRWTGRFGVSRSPQGGLRLRHSRTIALAAEPSVFYADASALVKRVVEEPESEALDRFLAGEPYVLATSRIAIVEVTRAVRLASPSPDSDAEAMRLLNSCLLVEVTDPLLRQARRLTSERVRSLDAIHLATASYVAADAVLVYDRRLAAACAAEGHVVTAPS